MPAHLVRLEHLVRLKPVQVINKQVSAHIVVLGERLSGGGHCFAAPQPSHERDKNHLCQKSFVRLFGAKTQMDGDAAQRCELVLEARHLGFQVRLLPVQHGKPRLLDSPFGTLCLAVLPRKLRVTSTMGAPFVISALDRGWLLGTSLTDWAAARR